MAPYRIANVRHVEEEREKLIVELKYRLDRLPKDVKDVEQCVAIARTSFDFCKGEFKRAVAEMQVGDAFPVFKERSYKLSKNNLAKAVRWDLPEAKAVVRNQKKRIRALKVSLGNTY
jgi:hypothetical protein